MAKKKEVPEEILALRQAKYEAEIQELNVEKRRLRSKIRATVKKAWGYEAITKSPIAFDLKLGKFEAMQFFHSNEPTHLWIREGWSQYPTEISAYMSEKFARQMLARGASYVEQYVTVGGVMTKCRAAVRDSAIGEELDMEIEDHAPYPESLRKAKHGVNVIVVPLEVLAESALAEVEERCRELVDLEKRFGQYSIINGGGGQV